MCEFKVYLDDEIIFEDVIFAEIGKGGVTLKDIIGEKRFVEGTAIKEVNVLKTRLVLIKT